MSPKRILVVRTIVPLLSSTERDEFTWGQVILIYEVWIRSWGFETKVGSGGSMAQTAVCVVGVGDTATSRHPPTTTTTTTMLWLLASSLIHSNTGFWWSVEIQPDHHVEINASASNGRWNALNAPLDTEDACCVSVLLVRLHLYHMAAWRGAPSSIKSTSIYFNSIQIHTDLDSSLIQRECRVVVCVCRLLLDH